MTPIGNDLGITRPVEANDRLRLDVRQDDAVLRTAHALKHWRARTIAQAQHCDLPDSTLFGVIAFIDRMTIDLFGKLGIHIVAEAKGIDQLRFFRQHRVEARLDLTGVNANDEVSIRSA